MIALLMTGFLAVVDGDTARLNVRLYGVDAPEGRQHCKDVTGDCYPCGQRAAEALKELVDGRHVTCTPTGQVSYGRPVVVCVTGDTDVGAELVRQGHAVSSGAYAEEETEAKAAGRGIWQGAFVRPRDWRKGERLCPPKR